jgi:hypothetical protein
MGMEKMAGPAGAAIGAISGLVTAIAQLAAIANPGLFEIFTNALQDIQGVLGQTLMPIFEAFIPIVQQFGDAVATLMPDIEQVREAIKPFVEVLQKFGERFMEIAQKLGPVVQEVLLNLFEAIGETMKAMFEASKPFIDILIDILIPVLKLLAVILKGISKVMQMLAVVFQFFGKIIKWLFEHSPLGTIVKAFGGGEKAKTKTARGAAARDVSFAETGAMLDKSITQALKVGIGGDAATQTAENTRIIALNAQLQTAIAQGDSRRAEELRREIGSSNRMSSDARTRDLINERG